MTSPQPLPPDPESQPSQGDTGQQAAEAAAVAAIAALLAAAGSAGATYMAGQVAQAGVVQELRGLGLTRKQAGKLVGLDAARPSPPVIPLQPSTRAVFKDGPTYRAQYLVNAAKRIVKGATVGEKPLGDLVEAERRYFTQHRTAQVQREQAAARMDAAANSYGALIGWNAVLDDRTTPECRAADGKNFYPSHPPAIGLPGLKHAGNCRCYPGPPHEAAGLVDPHAAPPDVIAASREETGMAYDRGGQMPPASVRVLDADAPQAVLSPAQLIELSAKTATYSTTHHPLGKPGGPGLWGHKNWQLPAYIQNIAKGIMESGQVDKSRAISIAIGKVRDWAEGKGNVTPEVRAASVKAIAEWEALRARAKAANLASDSDGIELTRHVRTEAGVRRYHLPIGSPIGGGGGRGSFKAPSALTSGHADKLSALDAKGRRDYAKGLSDKELADVDHELSRRATKLGKPGQVAGHHKAVKDEIASRKATPTAPGPAKPKAGTRAKPKTPAKPKPSTKPAGKRGLKAAPKKPSAKKPALAKLSDAQLAALAAYVRKQPGPARKNLAALVQALVKAIRDRLAARRTANLTAEPSQEIVMSKPMFGDKKPTAKDVRDMVAAHGKVPDQLKEKYRAKVIGHARAANALHHVPPAWLKGKGKPAAGK